MFIIRWNIQIFDAMTGMRDDTGKTQLNDLIKDK